jgi:hypothetical protein
MDKPNAAVVRRPSKADGVTPNINLKPSARKSSGKPMRRFPVTPANPKGVSLVVHGDTKLGALFIRVMRDKEATSCVENVTRAMAELRRSKTSFAKALPLARALRELKAGCFRLSRETSSSLSLASEYCRKHN